MVAPRLAATIGEYPMPILGYHFIFSAYGFWLPNDPRGSWSETVREFELRKFGPATKVQATRSVAARSHDRQLRLAAKKALRYPPVTFTGEQAVLIVQGFANAQTQHAYVIHALAILPDHVHLIMWHHGNDIDNIAAHLKAKATSRLNAQGAHPLAEYVSPSGRIPSPWARNYWCPFIYDEEHYVKAIAYVEQNPIKAGLRPQRWSIVTPYQRDKSRR
jgi:REP element-mobilizing transposase RayT